MSTPKETPLLAPSAKAVLAPFSETASSSAEEIMPSPPAKATSTPASAPKSSSSDADPSSKHGQAAVKTEL